MGNTSCRYVIKNELRKESNLYKNKHLLCFVSIFTIWYLYIQHKYTGYDKWYIMPSTAYVSCYIIINLLVYLLTEISMDKYVLNNRINQCLQWQFYNKDNCKKRFNKCIVNSHQINDWESNTKYNTQNIQTTPQVPVQSHNNIPTNQYMYPNFTQTQFSNYQNQNLSEMDEVKPGNFYG